MIDENRKPGGRFIVLEGGEGSGKTTQANLLAQAMGAMLTREPGGTPLGERLRAILLSAPGADAICDRAEALMMMADRAQHVHETLLPALEAGRDVVCDRYSGSTFAYQGCGRGLDLAVLRSTSTWAACGLEPDLVILLDVDGHTAAGRMTVRPDRIENIGGTFHSAVRAGFRQLAEDHPDHWVVVDGDDTISRVHDRIVRVVETRLGWVAA